MTAIKNFIITSIIVAASVAVVLFVVLLAVSFAVLSPNEMGLKYNVATKHIDRSKLYLAGRHYVGVGNYFVKYSRLVQTVSIPSISARSLDGLPISMELSFNYKVKQDITSVLYIYETLGPNYATVLKKIAGNVVRDVAATVEAFDFFSHRSAVVLLMNNDLTSQLLQYGFDVDSFQLLNMALPEAFSTAISQTQVAQQQITQVGFQQNATKVEAQTSIAEANRTASMVRLRAEAEAAAILSAKKSEAQALKVALVQEWTAYKTLMANLTLTTEQFVDWVWLSAMAGTVSPQTVVVTKPDLLK